MSSWILNVIDDFKDIFIYMINISKVSIFLKLMALWGNSRIRSCANSRVRLFHNFDLFLIYFDMYLDIGKDKW